MSKGKLLGIDTGGTYTDAVLIDPEDSQVVAFAKALTTHHNLAVGIKEAVVSLQAPLADVEMIGLSTTLATNAIVEGKGRPICLILIGYDRELIDSYQFWDRFGTADVVFIKGGHNYEGREKEPLDLEAAKRAILARRGKVEAFAVSGHFGIRNPAHELQMKTMVHKLTGLPVSCGHELSVQLDSIRRATTAVLNASLIPLLRELLVRVQEALGSLGISAPLMVVRGDGSLMGAEMAMEKPVETILSGPAASAVGGCYLSRLSKAWVVDVGGTTTDIAAFENCRPRLSLQGAHVGNWRTMVRAVDVHTIGLGGDSHVQMDLTKRLQIGPRRVVPLSLLAISHPFVLEELQSQTQKQSTYRAGEFVLLRWLPSTLHTTDEAETNLLMALQEGPCSWPQLEKKGVGLYLLDRALERLESLGCVMQAGFTPTDALHVLGVFSPWSVEAAEMGARLLAQQVGLELKDFCNIVVEKVSDRIISEILAKSFYDEDKIYPWPDSPGTMAFLERALHNVKESNLECRLFLRDPIVAIGAPVTAYMPRVAKQLNTQLVIPEHAAVANAIGAVVGSVTQVVEGLVTPLELQKGYRLHLGAEVRDFEHLEEAIAYGQRAGVALAREKAHAAGASESEVSIHRQDREAIVAGGCILYLGTELRFTAVGRPSIKRRDFPNSDQ